MEWLQILNSTELKANQGSKSAGPPVAPLIDLDGSAANSPARRDESELVGSTMQPGMYKGSAWHGRRLVVHVCLTDCFRQLAINELSSDICTRNTDDNNEVRIQAAEQPTAATAVLRQARLDVHRTLTFQVHIYRLSRNFKMACSATLTSRMINGPTSMTYEASVLQIDGLSSMVEGVQDLVARADQISADEFVSSLFLSGLWTGPNSGALIQVHVWRCIVTCAGILQLQDTLRRKIFSALPGIDSPARLIREIAKPASTARLSL